MTILIIILTHYDYGCVRLQIRMTHTHTKTHKKKRNSRRREKKNNKNNDNGCTGRKEVDRGECSQL